MVVAERTAPVKGRFLESLGFLNPHTKEKKLNVERIKHWLEKGAQCSDTVHNLLVGEGVIKGPKRAIKMGKKEESVNKELAEKEDKVEKEEKQETETEERKISEKPVKEDVKGEKNEKK